MCGRFSLTASPEEISALCDVLELGSFPQRYNIAPTQPILTLSKGETGKYEPLLVRWGLIPHWVKDPDDWTLIINARSETVNTKASFKTAMRHKRVLIPASGFYEWYRPSDKSLPKQAYWIKPVDDNPIFFGGIVDTWMGKDGTEIDTGCILTTQSNDQIGNIHHRMPVVIKPHEFDRWLDCKTQEPRDVMDLTRSVEDGFFEAIAVSDRVNKVANTGVEIQAPGKAESILPKPTKKTKPDNGQMDLF